MELLAGALRVGSLELTGEKLGRKRTRHAPLVIAGNRSRVLGNRNAHLDRLHPSILPRCRDGHETACIRTVSILTIVARDPQLNRKPRWPMASIALGAMLVLVGCADSGEDETSSTEELLEQLEGRDLTPAEVAEREEVAILLCGLDDPVLIEIWTQLNPAELAFQDIVFGRTCPERLDLYAASTGRFVSAEDG